MQSWLVFLAFYFRTRPNISQFWAGKSVVRSAWNTWNSPMTRFPVSTIVKRPVGKWENLQQLSWRTNAHKLNEDEAGKKQAFWRIPLFICTQPNVYINSTILSLSLLFLLLQLTYSLSKLHTRPARVDALFTRAKGGMMEQSLSKQCNWRQKHYCYYDHYGKWYTSRSFFSRIARKKFTISPRRERESDAFSLMRDAELLAS